MAGDIFPPGPAPEGAGPGTKGLSMFLVPKFLIGPDGTLGERNGVEVTAVEHKMGLHASTTCELTFGARPAVVGTLVGDTHDGIRQMFMIIEHARMMVGTKAIATLSTGYLTRWSTPRPGCRAPTSLGWPTRPPLAVTITHHPDVRRMLMTQKAYAEGMRALRSPRRVPAGRRAGRGGARGERRSHRRAKRPAPAAGQGRRLGARAQPLTLSLQTFGGSGYLQDYRIEQYIRDAKIDSLYEGTTAIQGMDRFFWIFFRNEGAALRSFFTQTTEFAAGESGNGRLKPERIALARAAGDVEAMVAALAGYAAASAVPPRGALPGRGRTPPACSWPSATWSSAGPLTRQAEVGARRARRPVRATPWTRRSTRASWPPRLLRSDRAAPGSRRSARIDRPRPRWTSAELPEEAF